MFKSKVKSNSVIFDDNHDFASHVDAIIGLGNANMK